MFCYVLSFLPGVYVGTLDLIASIPGLTFCRTTDCNIDRVGGTCQKVNNKNRHFHNIAQLIHTSLFAQSLTTTSDLSLFAQSLTTTSDLSLFAQSLTTTSDLSLFAQSLTTTSDLSLFAQSLTTTSDLSLFVQSLTTTRVGIRGATSKMC